MQSSTSHTDPRSPSTFLVFLGAAFAFSVVMIGTTMPTPLYPIYQDAFGFSQLMITIIFAAYAFGVIAALVITGRWSDQLGRRPLLFAGIVCSIISDLVFWQADGLAMILVGRVLSGLSAGIFTGTATVAVLELAPPHWRERATFFATAANMGGLGLGPMLAGALSQYLPSPLELTYLIHIALALLAFICIWRAPETVTRPTQPKLSLQRLNVPPEVRGVFVPAAIAGFAGFAVCGFFTSIAPAFTHRVRHACCRGDARSAGYPFSVAHPVHGRCSHRWHGPGNRFSRRPGRYKRSLSAGGARRGNLNLLYCCLHRHLSAGDWHRLDGQPAQP